MRLPASSRLPFNIDPRVKALLVADMYAGARSRTVIEVAAASQPQYG